jgi:YwiC-like protein
VNAATLAARGRPNERVPWIPRQHGAWAMLAVAALLGIAASHFDPRQLVLSVTAVSGYLASSAGLDWIRAHRRAYLEPVAVFGFVCLASGVPLLVAFPSLAVVGLVVVAGAAVTAGMARLGHPRSLVASLAQAAQAACLVPAMALVAGAASEPPTVVRATLVAGLYLAGSVLVVRSMIRERGNRSFRAVSIGYHVGVVIVEAWLLPAPYAVLAAALVLRTAGLPALQDRLAGGPHRLRPIHLGLVEFAASAALATLAFLVGF